jgi:predicted nucleic acid-binding protein
MNRLVLDASILVKLFINEEGSRSAANLVGKAKVLIAPDLLWAEAGNVLWKYCRRRELKADEAAAILADMVRMPIEILPSRDFIETALNLAIHSDRTVYDCLYLAAAVQEKGILLTADERLVNAFTGTPLARHLRLVGAGAR